MLGSRFETRGWGCGEGIIVCVVFLGKTLYSYSAVFYLGLQIGWRKFLGKPDEMQGGVSLHQTGIPCKGRVVIVLVTWCHLVQVRTLPTWGVMEAG